MTLNTMDWKMCLVTYRLTSPFLSSMRILFNLVLRFMEDANQKVIPDKLSKVKSVLIMVCCGRA